MIMQNYYDASTKTIPESGSSVDSHHYFSLCGFLKQSVSY